MAIGKGWKLIFCVFSLFSRVKVFFLFIAYDIIQHPISTLVNKAAFHADKYAVLTFILKDVISILSVRYFDI